MQRNSYVADDDVESIIHFDDDVEVGVGANYSELQDAGNKLQRLVVSRLQGEYCEGRLVVSQADPDRRNTSEKMFNISRYIEWQGGEPDILLDALRAGRLRCRLGAAAGTGKSTRLPFAIARELGHRVLHVALDARALEQVADYVRSCGIGKYRRGLRTGSRPGVCCMTYGDFRGHMSSMHRADIFKNFDTIIFDEAFVDSDDVFVSKRCFSVYAPAQTNLILCSATISTDRSQDDGAAVGLGNVKIIDRKITVAEAISSGKLFTDYLVDRTLVLVPDNEAVYALEAAYNSVGADIVCLDDASDGADVARVCAVMEGDSTVSRILIAHHCYGIAFNFPIEYVIKFPQFTELHFKGDTVSTAYVDDSEEMVLQAVSRAGRSKGVSSNAVVMSPERSGAGVLREAARVSAFVKLCAAYITPLRNDFWRSAFDIFPDGLTASLAQGILKLCLPVEVTVRYLASDGRYAARYARVLNAFAQPDHFLVSSVEHLPVNQNRWVSEEFSSQSPPIKVPFAADGELRVLMHVIEAMADGHITIERWRPQRVFSYGDGYDSDDATSVSARSKSVPKLRYISDKALPSLPAIDTIADTPWSYRAGGIEYGRRAGSIMDSGRVQEALLNFSKMVDDYVKPVPEIEEVKETNLGAVSSIMGSGGVESPGGSVICELPVKICEKLNKGWTLTSSEFIQFMAAIRAELPRVVQAKLFDCLSGPWDSVLDSLMDDNVVKSIIERGLAVDTYALVDGLRVRFARELKSILANSNVFKKRWLKVLKIKPTLDEIMRAVRVGNFDGVAQTDAYIARVRDVKERIDHVLLRAEKNNVYLPSYITGAQRALPLRGKAVLGYIGDGNIVSQSGYHRGRRRSSVDLPSGFLGS